MIKYIRGQWLICALALLALVGALTGCASRQIGADGQPVSLIIQNKGSDTLVNLALAWAEAYIQLHPEVRVSVTGGGSGIGIAALINGTVDIANASREMKKEEIAAAEANGISPIEFTVARDAIAVVVHPDNPVEQLTLQEIADIYTRRITNWQEVGGEARPIVLLSRESNSGTYVYFLENVIRLGNSASNAPRITSPVGSDRNHRIETGCTGYPDRLRYAVYRVEPCPSCESVKRW
jgi:phosphate transport system substrate-binding protein